MTNPNQLQRPERIRPGTRLSGWLWHSALLSVTFILWLACSAQSAVLFDFETGMGATTTFNQTVDGLKAIFSSSTPPLNYYIQPATTITGFPAPVGFTGNALVPTQSSLASDLLISFDHPLSDISIMYAVDNVNANGNPTLRLTAYSGLTWVGDTTATSTMGGTWPSATLALSPVGMFDNVVIHFDSTTATENFNPVFMIDNLLAITAVPEPVSAVGVGAGLCVLALLSRRLRKAKQTA
jgi:hypothetical protein